MIKLSHAIPFRGQSSSNNKPTQERADSIEAPNHGLLVCVKRVHYRNTGFSCAADM